MIREIVSKMRNIFVPSCGLIVSSVLITLGLFFLFILPSILEVVINREFRLSPTSKSFKHWRKTPVPVVLDFYLFNWTNPEKLDKEKPAFAELGPYRFYEFREKVNVTWNDNSTISYRQVRVWKFSGGESAGSMDDIITTINGVTLTAAYMMRNSGFIPQHSINMAFGFTKQKISVTHSVRDLLFDGYSNDLMTIANKLSTSIIPISSPFDKFAWFYQRNNSYLFDGWFNLDTGAKDMSRLGTIQYWNHKKQTGFYPGKCGQVEGFTGDMFPPGVIRRDTTVNLFSQDLCRTVPFDYTGDVEVEGLQAYRFSAGLHVVDNGSLDPENSCYCNGDCVPSGFLNLTTCRYGAPVFVSFPHFYDANPVYLKKVQGLKPDKKRHEFYLTIEPTYGIPIDVGGRVQLNMMMQPIQHISMYKNVPKLMFPVLWIDQRITISSGLARELQMVIMLPTIVNVLGAIFLSVGTVVFVAIIFLKAKRKKDEKDIGKPATVTETSQH